MNCAKLRSGTYVALLCFILASAFSAWANPPAPTYYPGTAIVLEEFQAALSYARRHVNSQGLGLSQEAARTWALNFARGTRVTERLAQHKTAYATARRHVNSGGLQLTASDSLEFADRMSDPFAPPQALENYLRVYRIARRHVNTGGFQMTASAAAAFAYRFSERPDGAAIFDAYSAAYRLARRHVNTGGLGLSSAEAHAFAADATGISTQASCILGVAATESAIWARAIRDQLPAALQPQVDQIYGSACMAGNLNPSQLSAALAPLFQVGQSTLSANDLTNFIQRINQTVTQACVSGAEHSDIPLPATDSTPVAVDGVDAEAPR